ncbi:CHRD domain-containing protein [Flavisolibacter sp. BT320]|nr:CHRD domain-containing protein [Flavisolibacter longurius]
MFKALNVTMRLLLFTSIPVLFTQCTKEARQQEEVPVQSASAKMKMDEMTKMYKAYLSPLNNSGVSGMATLKLEGNMLTVTIEASGLTPNQVHPQHIHGFTERNKNAKCPPMTADTDGDGLVELAEGAPFYGPVLLSLTPFPTATAEGNIMYSNTFTVDPALLPLQNNAIVLHGMMVDGTYWPTLPVACAQIMPANGMQ